MSEEAVQFQIESAEVFKASQRYDFKSLAEIDFTGEQEWLVHGLLPKKGVVLMYGASQSLKTFVALDLCIKIASGTSKWGEFEIDAQGKNACIYVAAEGMGGIEKRIAALKIRDNIKAAPFYLIADRPVLGKDIEPDKEDLIADIQSVVGQEVGVVVIDTLSQCLGGGEENGAGMQAIIAAATDISTYLDCIVILIHHTGHQGKDPRGHSSALGNPDTLLLLESDGNLKSKITIKKQKDGETGITIGVELSEVELGINKYGKSITTLVVSKVGTSAPSRTERSDLTASQRFFMKQFEIAFGDHRKEIKPFPDGPKVIAVSKDAVRDQFYAASAHMEDAAKRQAFKRAVNKLIEISYLITREVDGRPFFWKNRKEEDAPLPRRDRDNVTPLKGGVTHVTQPTVTEIDIVTQCHDVTSLQKESPPPSLISEPIILGLTYLEDGSVEL